MTLVAALVERLAIRSRVGEDILLIVVVARVLVAVRVHQVSAGAEFLVIVAHIEVETHILSGVYTIVAAKARKTHSRTIGEAHIISVVGTAEDSELVTIAESVHHEVTFVAVVGTISGRYITKPPIVHTFLNGEVDDGFVFAIVNTGKACQV